MTFHTVNTITFDVGGTLLFAHPSVGEVYAAVLARRGRECDPKALNDSFYQVWRRLHPIPLRDISEAGERARWRQVIDETFAGFADGIDMDDLFEELWDAFAHRHNWRWEDDTEPTLRELRRRGFQLAVFSNWDSRLRPLLEETGLAKLFDELFISCEMGMEKPHPAAFEKVRSHLDRSPSEILHIGDSAHHDIEGARQSGWHSLQIVPGLPPEHTGQITALSELTKLLPPSPGASFR